VEDIRMVLNSFSSWQIHHIGRIANNVTHGLVNTTVKHIINQVWMKEILNCICDVVLLEQYALFS
jgi:hypothetical protein